MSQRPEAGAGPTIDIFLATFNGARWLPDWLASLEQQVHRSWRLWVKDDGSSDHTLDVVRAAAAADPRITICEGAPTGLGAAHSFAWLWNNVAEDAAYVAFADQDDVWFPDRLSRTLAACVDLEGPMGRVPVLVHTDLEVVDEALRTIAPSFTRYSLIPRGMRSFRDVVRGNAATGCTMLANRALREAVGSLPDRVVMHDWWVACAAAAFGRTVYLDTPTVRYRQHGANVIGARRRDRTTFERMLAIVSALQRVPLIRQEIAQAAVQAGAFVEQYASHLTAPDREFAEQYARIPTLGWGARQLAVARGYWSRDQSLLSYIGLVVRS